MAWQLVFSFLIYLNSFYGTLKLPFLSYLLLLVISGWPNVQESINRISTMLACQWRTSLATTR